MAQAMERSKVIELLEYYKDIDGEVSIYRKIINDLTDQYYNPIGTIQCDGLPKGKNNISRQTENMALNIPDFVSGEIKDYEAKVQQLQSLKAQLLQEISRLKLKEKRRYPDPWRVSEGWGLTSDGKQLMMSDGTDRILFIDSGNLRLIRALRVADGNVPVRELNELEFAEGVLLANIWYRDKIAGIDPATGKVLFWLDISPLRLKLAKGADVANGIAWDAQRDKLYVTGKYWDKIFVIAPPSHIFPGEKR